MMPIGKKAQIHTFQVTIHFFGKSIRACLFTLGTMGKSEQLSQDLRKKIVDLHKSGSTGAICKQLKVP